ncbi:MAG: Uncharacterised protein [Marine Group II euryarchaeote MED-G33]|nr:MAG: Uncharacterised protein [Marine Group II euryarchaeote MED-G33]
MNQSRWLNGTIHLLDSTTKICTWIVIGTLQTLYGPKKSATYSCMVLTLTPKWSKAVRELSTKAPKFSTSHSALNLGTLCLPMKNKTTAGKYFAGVDIHPNQKPLVAVHCLITTTYSKSIQSLDRNFSTSHIGMLDLESSMYRTHQMYRTQKESPGPKITKLDDGLDVPVRAMVGMAPMVVAMQT